MAPPAAAAQSPQVPSNNTNRIQIPAGRVSDDVSSMESLPSGGAVPAAGACQYYENIHTGDRNKSDVPPTHFLALYGWAIIILAALAAAIVFVPVPPPPGSGEDGGVGHDTDDLDSSSFAKTCRGRLFNKTHSWQDYLMQIAIHTENWCDVSAPASGRCKCSSRIEAVAPSDQFLPWQATHFQNLKTAQAVATALGSQQQSQRQQEQETTRDRAKITAASATGRSAVMKTSWELLLLGDDLVERFQGKRYGIAQTELNDNAVVWSNLFVRPDDDVTSSGLSLPLINDHTTPNATQKIRGLAMGIAGTETPHLQYQLQNGLLDLDLQPLPPNIWWIVVGANDEDGGNNNDDLSQSSSSFYRSACDYRGILAGIIQATTWLYEQRGPDAAIVLNSVLPPASHRHFIHTVQPLNEAMECYAAGHLHQNVHFFNATGLFLALSSNVAPYRYKRNESLFVDRSSRFPNALGYQVWGQAIADKIRKLQS